MEQRCLEFLLLVLRSYGDFHLSKYVFYFIYFEINACNVVDWLSVTAVFQYWEKAEFPFECLPHIASLLVAGGTTKVRSLISSSFSKVPCIIFIF